MEKLTVKEQAEIRAQIYSIISHSLSEAGYTNEPFSEGRIISLGNGQYGKLKFSICDPTKFSIEETREEFAEKTKLASERAEVARKKAEEKAQKALEKASQAAEKIN